MPSRHAGPDATPLGGVRRPPARENFVINSYSPSVENSRSNLLNIEAVNVIGRERISCPGSAEDRDLPSGLRKRRCQVILIVNLDTSALNNSLWYRFPLSHQGSRSVSILRQATVARLR